MQFKAIIITAFLAIAVKTVFFTVFSRKLYCNHNIKGKIYR